MSDTPLALRTDPTIERHDHGACPSEIGPPQAPTPLEDAVSEGPDSHQARPGPQAFPSAIGPGTDFAPAGASRGRKGSGYMSGERSAHRTR